jgi:hypothetical protein
MTTETKATHTPGPWEVSTKRGLNITAKTRGGADFALAAVWTTLTGEAADANARLIAAAPDLLAACEAALPAIRWGLAHQGGNYSQYEAVEQVIVAAIAKARGEVAS